MELYYGIIGEENLGKKGLNWTNWKFKDQIGRLWGAKGLKCNLPKSC